MQWSKKYYMLYYHLSSPVVSTTNCALSLQTFFFIWQSRRIVVLAWSRGQWSFLSRCLFIWLAIIHSVTCSDDRCSVDRLIPSFFSFLSSRISIVRSRLDFRFFQFKSFSFLLHLNIVVLRQPPNEHPPDKCPNRLQVS